MPDNEVKSEAQQRYDEALINLKGNKNIYRYFTKTAALIIDDSLNFDWDNVSHIHNTKESKIKITVLSLIDNKSTNEVTHSLNAVEAKELFRSILSNDFMNPKIYNSQYIEYKGSPSSEHYNGAPESRVLYVKFQPAMPDGTAMKLPFSVQITRGRGKLVQQGAITPNGNPDLSLTARLSMFDIKKISGVVLDYIRNWEAAQMQTYVIKQHIKLATAVGNAKKALEKETSE